MKKIILILLLIGCKETIIEPIKIEKFDCSGVWASNTKINPNQLYLYILQTNESQFIADIFHGFNFIGSIENGKIIGKEKFVSFSFKQQTFFGETSMGFNGRFYKIENEWELRGLLSGRIYTQPGVVWIFDSEQYKFTKCDMAYLFKISN